MDKPIRKAVRCYLIKDNKVVVIKYKNGHKKEGYYDIPGGKIETGETPKQTAIREMKEETGLVINNLKHKGHMIIEYPQKIYDFEVFFTKDYKGELQEFKEISSEWIEIEELLQQEKILSDIMILDKFFIKGLIDHKYNFCLNIEEDEQENILYVDFSMKEI